MTTPKSAAAKHASPAGRKPRKNPAALTRETACASTGPSASRKASSSASVVRAAAGGAYAATCAARAAA
ncbi:83776e01-c6e6-4b46-a7cf-fd9df688aa73 [Thermothielavioides terrestris]|uniref:83776e01-c6e6-4b46-a7cf-fd9df688aa73 n=1 Tax=Thermothielavioides terrestris TaxID=2587410 RepID=A0A3S4D0Q8_9PEZI|nr:83776e01-c6e6-4b46-a7cf-fd9df688aa73 [Thermothielavioides terrestris]